MKKEVQVQKRSGRLVIDKRVIRVGAFKQKRGPFSAVMALASSSISAINFVSDIL